jgi:hypothetical protein
VPNVPNKSERERERERDRDRERDRERERACVLVDVNILCDIFFRLVEKWFSVGTNFIIRSFKS